jgi:hypothetical protein
MDFLIVTVGLCIIVGIIFAALEFPQIAPDPQFKQIARYAVGGAALLAFLVAIKGVFFGGVGASISALAILELAIAIIVLLVVLFIIGYVLQMFAPEPLLTPIRYVIAGIALIVILLVAAQALFGGGLGFIGSNHGGLLHQPGPFIPSR